MPMQVGSIIRSGLEGWCARCESMIHIGDKIRIYEQATPTTRVQYCHYVCNPRRKDNSAPRPATPRPVPAPRTPAPDVSRLADMVNQATASQPVDIDERLRHRSEEIQRVLMAKLEASKEEMRASLLAELADKMTVTLKWELPDGSIKPLPDGLYHAKFQSLLRNCQKKIWTYLYGPPGSGKTEAAKQVATALELDFEMISLTQSTFDSRLVGYQTPDGKYVETGFYRMFTNGGVFLIDEIDNSNGNTLTVLNTALANQKFSFPCGMRVMHKDFVCMATGNTTGYGGSAAHQDRSVLDAATRNRFFFLEWSYDWKLVRKITNSINTNQKVQNWVDWVEMVSMYCSENYPELMVTPRAAISGAKMLHTDATIEELMHGLVFQGYDSASVRRIIDNCGSPR